MKPGFFISFEGAEAVGKSTQIKQLAKSLGRLGHKVHITREPGGTPVGEHLRKIHKQENISPLTELFVVEASRAEHVEKFILPRLKKGEVVISDRYQESTLVYQGFCRGIDLQKCRAANRLATQGLNPDLIIWLDLDPKSVSQRLKIRKGKPDRFDQASTQFHRKVINSYRKLAQIQKSPRLHRFNANKDIKELEAQILQLTLKKIKRRLRK